MAKKLTVHRIELWIKIAFALTLFILGGGAWAKYGRKQVTLTDEEKAEDVLNLEIVDLAGYSCGFLTAFLTIVHIYQNFSVANA